jgi:hypothetical protein
LVLGAGFVAAAFGVGVVMAAGFGMAAAGGGAGVFAPAGRGGGLLAAPTGGLAAGLATEAAFGGVLAMGLATGLLAALLLTLADMPRSAFGGAGLGAAFATGRLAGFLAGAGLLRRGDTTFFACAAGLAGFLLLPLVLARVGDFMTA